MSDTLTCSMCTHADLKHALVILHRFSANRRDRNSARITYTLPSLEQGEGPIPRSSFIAVKQHMEKTSVLYRGFALKFTSRAARHGLDTFCLVGCLLFVCFYVRSRMCMDKKKSVFSRLAGIWWKHWAQITNIYIFKKER